MHFWMRQCLSTTGDQRGTALQFPRFCCLADVDRQYPLCRIFSAFGTLHRPRNMALGVPCHGWRARKASGTWRLALMTRLKAELCFQTRLSAEALIGHPVGWLKYPGPKITPVLRFGLCLLCGSLFRDLSETSMVWSSGNLPAHIKSVGSEAKPEQQLERKFTRGHKLIRMIMEADVNFVTH